MVVFYAFLPPDLQQSNASQVNATVPVLYIEWVYHRFKAYLRLVLFKVFQLVEFSCTFNPSFSYLGSHRTTRPFDRLFSVTTDTVLPSPLLSPWPW